MAKFPANGLDVEDFTFSTEIYTVVVAPLGTSYRCYLSVAIKDIRGNNPYRFTRWKASDIFVDLFDPQTGAIKNSAVDQCKTYINQLEANVSESKLFDRHAILSWNRNKTVQSCYVTYIQVTKN
jgi:hypothetical protein